MRKEIYYTYLGTNGTLTTPIHLEGIYYTTFLKVTADSGKYLTKDGKEFVKSITVADEDELAKWTEVESKH